MTIAELRRREVRRLAEFKSPEPTEADVDEARRLMNSFYRLCGLSETNLEMANDSTIYNAKRLAKSEERESRWYERLNAEFKKLYGLRLVYCGYAPSIGTVGENGSFSEKITRYFYD